MIFTRLSRLAWASFCLALLAAPAPGQVAPGHRLYGTISGNDTHLVDTAGNVVHTWTSSFLPGQGIYLDHEGYLLRAVRTFQPQINGAGGGVQRLDFDGTVLWDFQYNTQGVLSHHDIEPLPNGNVLLIAWEDKTPAEAIAAGRNPANIPGTVFLPDHIVEVEPTGPTAGAIVWEWHAWDHLVQEFDPSKANYGVVANHPELIDVNYPAVIPANGDWIHGNSIRYDPANDWIVFTTRHMSEVWIIDHGTTTAQAAGHTGGNAGKGGDLLYRWGNPAAHGAGTPADQQLFGPHSGLIIPEGYPGEGNVLVFNNDVVGAGTNSAVWELVLPLDPSSNFVLGGGGTYGPAAPVWSYMAPGFYSNIMSGAERLPNGNTLIASAVQGDLFEVTPAGQSVWSFDVPGAGAASWIFHTHYYDRSLWGRGRELSTSTGGTIDYEILQGSAASGSTYLLAFSGSGTTPGWTVGGLTVPLNFDPLLLFSLQSANTPLFTNTFGTLDGLGRASASLNLPPASPPYLIGATVHAAHATLDVSTLALQSVGNPVAFTLTP